MAEFPWTYDQYQRYRVLKEFLKIFFEEIATLPTVARNDKTNEGDSVITRGEGTSRSAPTCHPERSEGSHRPSGQTDEITVLDVGGLSPDRTGQSFWLPIKAVAPGPTTTVDFLPWDEPGYVQGDGRSLPFEDGIFDVVCALDVLEHVPADGRARFLEECARVAKRAVFLCAPFKSAEIEEAEDLLGSQVQKLFGVGQQQLKEHKKLGLPAKESVSDTLAPRFPASADFSYGSLRTGLPYQSLKNSFMLRRNSGEIQALLDAWMTALSADAEFEPPFARHYWLFAKDVSQKEMADKVEVLKSRLRQPDNALPAFEDLAKLQREIVDYQTKKRVSALVVHTASLDNLTEALDHVLTQRVDFDFEVAVWDISGDAGAERFVQEYFPAVKYLAASPEAKLPNALLHAASRLLGDYILLLAEDILLPADAAAQLYRELERDAGADLLAPSEGAEPGAADRIFSECLFFRREALWERKPELLPLMRQNLFLWERAEEGKPLRFAAGIPISRKRQAVPPMKVLHCMHQYHPARGGSEWLMQNVSEKLAARSHSVKVIATNAFSTEDYFLPHRGKNLMPLDEKEIGGVTVKRVPFNRKGAAFLNLLRAAANRFPVPLLMSRTFPTPSVRIFPRGPAGRDVSQPSSE